MGQNSPPNQPQCTILWTDAILDHFAARKTMVFVGIYRGVTIPSTVVIYRQTAMAGCGGSTLAGLGYLFGEGEGGWLQAVERPLPGHLSRQPKLPFV